MNKSSMVREFIVKNFLFGNEEKIKDTTPFFESGVLDSTDILDVVAFIEKQWSIRVEDDELVPENFENLECLGRYLQKKVGTESQCAESPESAI